MLFDPNPYWIAIQSACRLIKILTGFARVPYWIAIKSSKDFFEVAGGCNWNGQSVRKLVLHWARVSGLLLRLQEAADTQAMLHVGAGRSNVLRRLLVDAGVGCDERLSRLALYPAHSEEKRRVDGVLARKMGLGSLCYWAVRPGVSSVKGSGATCTGAQPVYTEDRQCEPGCIRSRSTQESSGAGDAGGWLACRKERTHVPPL